MRPEILNRIETVSPLISRRKVQAFVFDSLQEGNSLEGLLLFLEKEKFELAIAVLSHPEFERLIDDGCITFAAVKPHTEESRMRVADDLEGEEKVLSMVKPPLEIIFQTALAPTRADLDLFYPGLKEQIGEEGYKKYFSYMLSGSITYFILYDPNGNAINEWRSQIGSTDPSNANSDSIRGKFAHSVVRNLVHGSDNKDNAKREVLWLKDCLCDYLRRLNSSPVVCLPAVV